VASAYDWPVDLADDEILRRLLDLDLARAAANPSPRPSPVGRGRTKTCHAASQRANVDRLASATLSLREEISAIDLDPVLRHHGRFVISLFLPRTHGSSAHG
jgi:hypothetical protein